ARGAALGHGKVPDAAGAAVRPLHHVAIENDTASDAFAQCDDDKRLLTDPEAEPVVCRRERLDVIADWDRVPSRRRQAGLESHLVPAQEGRSDDHCLTVLVTDVAGEADANGRDAPEPG